MIGSFVKSKAGHDKDSIYVVVAEEKEYVLVSDGKLKKLDAPKKKSKKHIQPINQKVNKDLLDKLMGVGQATNEEVKYAIKCYLNQIPI